MKLFIFPMLLFFTLHTFAQHYEHYYDYRWQPSDATTARFFSEIDKKDTLWERKDFYIHERSLQMKGTYTDTACKVAEGIFLYYFPNKSLQFIGKYKDGKKDGLWMHYYSNGYLHDSITYSMGNKIGTSYSWYPNGYLEDSAVWNNDMSGVEVSWFDNGIVSEAGRYSAGAKMNGKWQFFHQNGSLSSLESYTNGILTDKKYFDEQGISIADTINKDHEALFPGGMNAWQKYLSKSLYFPEEYQFENADKAVVVVNGIIDEQGNMTNVEISTPLYPAFDNIALKVIKASPKWQPAIEHNRQVKYAFLQAVYFQQ